METARHSPPPSRQLAQAGLPVLPGPFGRAQLLAAAHAIGEQLRARSLRTASGSVTWLGPTGYGTQENPLSVVQLGPNLYDGTSGIALFMAALARVSGDASFRDLALQTLEPLRQKLVGLAAEPARADALRMSVGGLMGLSSYLYALLRVGTLLEEPSLVDAAHSASSLVTPARIAGDMRPRLQTGSAGALLVLLALDGARPGPNSRGRTPLELAVECARHLLATRTSFGGMPRAWALSPRKPPLGDFCYGAAGICHALRRLHGVTGLPELLEAADEGDAFVHGLYSPAHGNWRDIRATIEARARKQEGSTWRDFWFSDWGDKPEADLDTALEGLGGPLVDAFSGSWCHGGPGIVLGRLASLHLLDSPAVREEIAGALPQVRAYAQPELFADGDDDLCCGHMGRADVLHQAHLVTGDEPWGLAAMSLAHQVWLRSCEREGYSPSAARGTRTFAPSLFQGVAGVGYGFLRLAEPGLLPSVLLLE